MSRIEALSLALALSITAPSDEKARECADMAASIADIGLGNGELSAPDIEAAKLGALALIEQWESEYA